MSRSPQASYSVHAVLPAAVTGLVLLGCATVPPGGTPGAAPVAQVVGGAQWTTVAGALGTEADAVGGDETGAGFSDDPVALEQTLAVACAEGKASGKAGFLRSLVGRLYSSGIDPATSTEALVRVGCAPLSALVRELVAQGGEPAVAPVVQRALFLAGPGAQGLVETAASDGLRADLGGVGGEGAKTGEALAWVPAGGRSAATVAATGYGLYTFVLPGRPTVSGDGVSPDRLGELLRVIEFYAFSGDAGAAAGSWDRQVFLFPVDPARHGEPLAEQISASLAADARAALAARLRYLGRVGLATRLETSPGPFLVSATQPGLLPVGRADAGARLLVDLSALGPEYMYAVVDAYDRPIPDGAQGTGESLDPIRTRLLALFGAHSGDVGAARDQTFLLSLQAPTAEPAADGG